MQIAWNDDESRIKFEILEVCDDDELQEREKYYIDYCKNVGWNVVNKQKKIVRKSSVKDTKNMKLAQRGENNGNASLSEEQAFEIILHKQLNLLTQKELAEIYNVSQSQISKIGIEKWTYLIA